MYTLGIGWLVSAVYFSAIMVCLYFTGHYTITSIKLNFASQLAGLSFYLLVGVCEEVVFRGIVYRMISDKWNVVVGLIVSALLFGFLHIFNDGATVWSSLAIALNSGWFMGIAYSYHQTIWVPIGMHWGWNYLQGNIFGCSVSGDATVQNPLFTHTFHTINIRSRHINRRNVWAGSLNHNLCDRDWHLYRLHRAVYQKEENAWSRTRNAVLRAFSRRYAMELAVNKVALTPIG